MASLAGAKVVALKNLGDKIALLTLEIAGKQGDVKAWRNELDGVDVGYEFKSGETEKKPPYNKPNAPEKEHETWIKSPPKGKGGSSPAKSDPVKNEIIKNANQNNNATIQYSSNLKSATSCAEMAVTTLGPGLDVNAYRERAFDLYQIIQEIAAIGSAQK